MFKNLFNSSLRYLLKNRSYLFINLAGLVAGIVTSVLIFLFVQDELSFDRFHPGYENIYRMETVFDDQGEKEFWAATNCVSFMNIQNRYPEIISSARLYNYFLPIVMESGRDIRFSENEVFFADSSFFDIFTFEAIEGNLPTALDVPDNIVLTEKTAKRYFGDSPALGRILRNDSILYTVSAVIKDIPANSHFHFDILAPVVSVNRYFRNFDNARNLAVYSYLVLNSNEASVSLSDKLTTDGCELYGLSRENLPEGFNIAFRLQPLKKIHLDGHSEKEIEPNGDRSLIFIFISVGLLILIISSVNYMNLSTAQSMRRASEVGVRKTIGAYRMMIFRQFMAESLLLVLIAVVLAYFIVLLINPLFGDFTGKSLVVNPFVNIPLLLFLTILILVVGFFSGSYPAVFLSRFNPLSIIKSGSGEIADKSSGSYLPVRKILVVFQYAMSALLIIGSIVVFSQLRYINNKDVGFDKKNVISVNLSTRESMFMSELLEEELGKIPNVESVGASFEVPGQRVQVLQATVPSSGASINEGQTSDGESYSIRTSHADAGMMETFRFTMDRGRWFSDDFPGDKTGSYIINEAAIPYLGLEEPVLGQLIERPFAGPDVQGNIIGVVKDYNYASVHTDVEPLLIVNSDAYRYINLRISENSRQSTIENIRNRWTELLPDVPFSYTFVEETYDDLYRSEQNMATIISLFTVLAVFVSALGLFGLASFMAEKRTKEIGIRKVCGASVNKVLSMFGREYMILVLLANLIAFIPAYTYLNRWLQNFAYRIDVSVSVFVITAIITFLLAFVTVSFRTYRAAVVNPARALKHD